MRGIHRALVSCWLCALAALAPGSALADDPLEGTAEGKALEDKAGALYLEGVALYKQSKWQEARVAFLAAWRLKQHWQIAGNLADTETQLGRPREAAEYMTYYIRNAPADRRERAEALLKEATAKIATVTVKVEPAGAEVLVDGVPVGRGPLAEPLFLEPGVRTVIARYAGLADVGETLELAAGSTQTVWLTLTPAPGETDVAPRVEPAPDSGMRTGLLVGGTALSAILLGGGVVFTVLSNGKASEAQTKLGELQNRTGFAPCRPGASAPECEGIKELRKDRDTYRDVAIFGYVAAGISVAATVTYGLWPTSKAPVLNGMSVAPWMGGGTSGLILTGTY